VTVTALVSGGKDSIYAAYLSETQGWPVDELLTLRPAEEDSLLFHTPNLDLVALQAEAWGKSHRRCKVVGSDEAAELSALERAVAGEKGPIVCGAIESSYQWARLVRIASKVGRRLYAPLWRRDPLRVVREEIAAGLDIRFVHLAAEGLAPSLLGARLTAATLPELERLSASARPVHLAGEGGEYETLVVDAPFFAGSIELDRVERTVGAQTARLDIWSAHLKRRKEFEPGGTTP
jgi:uncharacterized protein (TIGR00290 family)